MVQSSTIHPDPAARRPGLDGVVTQREHPSGAPDVARLVALAKDGDRDALRSLYELYAATVYGYVHSIVGDAHDAEDVTQQIFTKLITGLGTYDAGEGAFAPWLLRVARNASIDHLRRRREVPAEEVRFPLSLDDSDRDRERVRSLHESLSSLPRAQGQVLILRHLVGLSPGEIAKRLNRTQGSVYALHHRAGRTLREMLRRLEAQPAPKRRSN